MKRAKVYVYRNVFDGHPRWCSSHPRPTLVTAVRREHLLRKVECARCVACDWSVEGKQLEACRAFDRLSRLLLMQGLPDCWAKFNLSRAPS